VVIALYSRRKTLFCGPIGLDFAAIYGKGVLHIENFPGSSQNGQVRLEAAT
jgi:hypothetical protein